MLLRDGKREPEHRRVIDLPGLLQPGDLLVFNDTRVLPARLEGHRQATGGRIEGLYLNQVELEDPAASDATDQANAHGVGWRVMLQAGGRLRPGERIVLSPRQADDHAPPPQLQLIDKQPGGLWRVALIGTTDTFAALERCGRMPLPPYIRRRRENQPDEPVPDSLDRDRYQTVYANRPGAVAAPTAGLHFTESLLGRLAARGVETARLTLHVGMGTFAPVRAADLADHDMHAESFTVPARTLGALRAGRDQQRRIIPVGTTCVRALESLPDPLPDGSTGRAYQAVTRLLIQPGFAFRFCDGLMTNFHLPRSTLIALVAARVGLDRLLDAYRCAVEQEYRFYSYGDAMLILP
jgi:S-adenosylmethionine:tRNA ribosyltransferase-isomerase